MDQNFQPTPLVGSPLPNMELNMYHNGKLGLLNLSSLRGKWLVLFFYPADFTFVCPTELQELAAMYPELQKIDTEVVSVSTDTAYAHMAWHDMSPAIKTVEFPMAADTNGKLSKTLGVYIEDEGQALRGTFIVDPEGVIKAVEVNDNSIGRSAQELFRKVQAAQYVASHNGEVCPASWTPDKAALKKSDELVGKI